jgi:hypothetical protein
MAKKQGSTAGAVRVLLDHPVDGVKYKCGDVVVFPDDIRKSLVDNGVVDTHPDAIAHATDVEGREVQTHQKPEPVGE